jgi:hypothetical protein
MIAFVAPMNLAIPARVLKLRRLFLLPCVAAGCGAFASAAAETVTSMSPADGTSRGR